MSEGIAPETTLSPSSDNTKQRVRKFLNHLKPVTEDSTALRQSCRAASPRAASKIVPVESAVAAIKDYATLTMGGFVGCGSPEYLTSAVRRSFDTKGCPSGLHVFIVATTGNRKGAGADCLAKEGLIAKYTFGWTGNCPSFARLIKEEKIEAWNLPLGIVSHMIRDAAAKRVGPVSKIGLGTFVDPREGGGKLNRRTTADVAQAISLGGEEYLWFKAPKIDVALIRGSTADVDGNVTFEKETFYGDALNMAIAAHSNSGLVIVQVERIVKKGSLHPRLVHLPAALVDKIVVAPAHFQSQTIGSSAYDGALSGEIRKSLTDPSMDSLPMGTRKIIAHRCMLAFDRPRTIVNLGVGMPEGRYRHSLFKPENLCMKGVAPMVNKYAAEQIPHVLPITLSTEVGVVGGFPAAGPLFGAAYNPEAVMPTSTMIDLIQGGNLDAAVLGCAEVDAEGNVNVSKFSDRHPGCGGFIDISQSAKQVIFAGTFTSGGLKVAVSQGKLSIVQEGQACKFKRKVQEKTFAGSSGRGRQILYVTERCVFKLVGTDQGSRVQLVEVAPGIRVQEDVLDKMEFAPLLGEVQQMDRRCFCL